MATCRSKKKKKINIKHLFLMTNLLLLQCVLRAGGHTFLSWLECSRVIKRLRESGGGGEDLQRRSKVFSLSQKTRTAHVRAITKVQRSTFPSAGAGFMKPSRSLTDDRVALCEDWKRTWKLHRCELRSVTDLSTESNPAATCDGGVASCRGSAL